MKYFLFLILAINYSFSQSDVELKILDTLIYKDRPFNVSIINNSKNTYLFFIDNLYQGESDVIPGRVLDVTYPIVVLEDDEKNEIPRTQYVESSHCNWERDRKSVIEMQILFEKQFKPLGDGVVVLKPYEKFNLLVSLNLTKDKRYLYNVDYQKNYNLFLIFDVGLIRYKDIIPKETLEFIEKFNILVFDTKLISNKVDLILNKH